MELQALTLGDRVQVVRLCAALVSYLRQRLLLVEHLERCVTHLAHVRQVQTLSEVLMAYVACWKTGSSWWRTSFGLWLYNVADALPSAVDVRNHHLTPFAERVMHCLDTYTRREDLSCSSTATFSRASSLRQTLSAGSTSQRRCSSTYQSSTNNSAPMTKAIATRCLFKACMWRWELMCGTV